MRRREDINFLVHRVHVPDVLQIEGVGSKVMHQSPSYHIIIMGNFNAKLGSREDHNEILIRGHGIEEALLNFYNKITYTL